MSISQHPGSKPAGRDGKCEYLAALRRDVVLASVITALLLAGVAVGGSRAAWQEPLLVQSVEVSRTEPVASDYFPAKHVNRGVESVEELPTF